MGRNKVKNILLVSPVSLEPYEVGVVFLIGMQSQGCHFHFITNDVPKNIRYNLLKKIVNIIYLNINSMSIIHFENVLKIYLKYAKNMSLFHSILKNILLF
jgi:hypothetical protein